MLSCVTEVGLFFKYSPKWSHVLEATLLEYNMMKNVVQGNKYCKNQAVLCNKMG